MSIAISCSLPVFTKEQTLKLKKRNLSIGPANHPAQRQASEAPVTQAIQTMELDHHKENYQNLRQRWLVAHRIHDDVVPVWYADGERKSQTVRDPYLSSISPDMSPPPFNAMRYETQDSIPDRVIAGEGGDMTITLIRILSVTLSSTVVVKPIHPGNHIFPTVIVGLSTRHRRSPSSHALCSLLKDTSKVENLDKMHKQKTVGSRHLPASQ